MNKYDYQPFDEELQPNPAILGEEDLPHARGEESHDMRDLLSDIPVDSRRTEKRVSQARFDFNMFYGRGFVKHGPGDAPDAGGYLRRDPRGWIFVIL